MHPEERRPLPADSGTDGSGKIDAVELVNMAGKIALPERNVFQSRARLARLNCFAT